LLKLREGIVELYKKVTTSLPPDVEAALRSARELTEAGSQEERTLLKIIEEVRSAREGSRLICKDTGIPQFHVKVPLGVSHKEIEAALVEATRIATEKNLLEASAIDAVSGVNSGDNTGEGFPVICLEESPDATLSVDLMLAGSEAENEGRTYRLPDESLGAQRDLEGIRKCIIDAVEKAGGRGCPPYIIGVGIGATREQAAKLSKKQLLRRLSDKNADVKLSALEHKVIDDINIPGSGLVALGVKIGVNHRYTESYIVDVSLSCWATRRGKLLW
jgi:fumarate hydratase class I